MAYIARDIESVVKNVTEEYPALILTGPRQVGKTTLLKLAEGTDRQYVSLDDLVERKLAKNDPALFLQTHKPPLLIDEVQYAPELFPYLKILIDGNHEPGGFWLTGAQSFRLMDLAQESLAGRIAVLQMSTLSQNELYGKGENVPFAVDFNALSERARNRTAADTPALFERVFKGSMPAVASGSYSNPGLFYSSYLSTYVERDVRELSGAIDALRFADFIASAACRCSQMLNVAEIANDVGIDVKTAKDWLGILEKSGIIFYLHPYSRNLLKRTVKKPKLYFFDTGLVCYLTRWDGAATLERGAMSGAILENYVVAELMKSYTNSAKTPYFYYLRDNNAREIDVIMERNNQASPLEIKKTASPGPELTRTFKILNGCPLHLRKTDGAGRAEFCCSYIAHLMSELLRFFGFIQIQNSS